MGRFSHLKQGGGGNAGGAGGGSIVVPKSSNVDVAVSELWEEVSEEFTLRATFMGVVGDTDSGRTRFSLTAPGPIAYLHCGEKKDGLIEEMRKSKLIRVHDFGGVFSGNNQAIADAAGRNWMKFRKAFMEAFGWAKTIVVDTDTDLWELLRLARFGAIKPTGGRVDANYGPVNAEFRSLAQRFRAQEMTNVIFISKTGDEYVKSKTGQSTGMGERTGRTIRRGMKDVPYWCDVVVRCHKIEATSDKPRKFRAVVEKGWFNAHSEGTKFSNALMTFPNVMAAVTNTEEEEWNVARKG